VTRFDGIMASWLNYWFGSALDVFLSVTAIMFGFSCAGLVPALGAALAGALYYTWFEYAVHRWLYHGRDTVFAVVHFRHHAEPETIIGAPFYYSLTVGVIHVAVASAIAGLPIALAFTGTMLACHAQQSLIHHSTHRYPGPDVLGSRSALRRHHALHHATHEGNYGISTTMWDRLLGTHVTPRASHAARGATARA
jgi:sterol desaturase/sphingolipid hydroxylase (fatty acid hydroxylase superfamily)